MRYETVYLFIGDREGADHIRADGVPSNVVEALHHISGMVHWATFEVSDTPHYGLLPRRFHWSDITAEGDASSAGGGGMTDATHHFGDGHDHGPCPTCGHNYQLSAPLTVGGTAALAAAPTVDDLVYCEGLDDVLRTHHTDGGVESYHAYLKRPCEATHRTLLLGPEVAS